MFPPPSHLQNLVLPLKVDASKDDDTEFVGALVCPCGCNEFILLYAGGAIGKGKTKSLGYAEVDGENFYIVKARCTRCDAEHLIFDDDFHGWNGYVCAPVDGNRNRRRPDLEPWECAECSCLVHKATVWIIGDTKEFYLKENEGILNEVNWFEAFGSFIMSIECVTCGLRRGGWAEVETM